jgi:hypothetical protein
MNQAEKTFLDRCERAFVFFCERFPDYPQTEANAREMARELAASNLQPDNSDHLAVIWERLRPKTGSVSAPSEPEQISEVEKEARRRIESGEITLEKIEALSANQLELASRSSIFNAAVEILSPRRNDAELLTRGELALAAGQAAVDSRHGIDTSAAQKIEEAARWKREHFAKISTAKPVSSGVRSGVFDWSRQPQIDKPVNVRAALAQERADNEFIEQAAEKRARRIRVLANKKAR